MIKWSEREPDNKRTIICYYRGSQMLYWINSEGAICDAHTGMISLTKNACWTLRKIKEGYWKYANNG